jgi:2-polyprenyl-3-methyl-5-hydroxy-6-metoxy-1,4-benzoquinol methylase
VPWATEKLDQKKIAASSFSSRKSPELMHYRLLLCKKCDLVFANPAPSEAWLEKNYQEASFDSGTEAICASKTYLKYLKPFLHDVSNQCALDVGTGEGSFLKELLGVGFRDVRGVEPSKAPIERADPIIKDRIKPTIFHESDFQSNSFDLISCFQTLEHLYQPLSFVSSAVKLLKNGGKLYIVVHNRNGLVNRLLGAKSPIYDIEHLQLFSPASTKSLLESAGFKILSCTSIMNVYPISYWIKISPLPQVIKKVLKKLFVGLLDIHIPIPVGNLAVIGEKQS